ncbi:hypothetical protein TYRP_023006 [Tyrophagus putrescentiae]|nr:hypothetical protein TYRP_023006 [Tyrophagus putrescentiae]
MTHPLSKRQTTLTILKNDIRYSTSRHVGAVNAPNIEDDQKHSNSRHIAAATRPNLKDEQPFCDGYGLIIFDVGGVNRPYVQASGVSYPHTCRQTNVC